MVDRFTTTSSLGQTTPVDRVRDSRRGGIDQEGKRKRLKKPVPSAPVSAGGLEAEDPGPSEDVKKSGKIVDIVI
jgi:hypothetical protein